MKNLIIWVFGNNDVYLGNKPLLYFENNEFKNKSFKEKLDILLENFDRFVGKISFPIFNAFYEQVISKEEEYNLIWIVSEDVDDKSDTKEIVKLLEKYLHFKEIKNINILPISEHIILRYIYEVDKISDALALYFESKNILDFYDKIYLNITWWTKIMALSLFCVLKNLRKIDNIFVYYAIWDKDNNITKFINFNYLNFVC